LAVSLGHVRGKTHVNQKPIEELDQLYQYMIPKIVAEYDDPSVKTVADLALWGRQLRGKEKSFAVDGVLLRLENGEKVAVPLIMFADEERSVLETGWENWAAQSTKEEEKRRQEFLTQTAAQDYQQQREAQAQINQRIQMMQLEMLAVNNGFIEIWEVMLLPRPGVAARPTSVIVSAQNSQSARLMAEQNYRGFVAGAVRQINY